MAGQSRYPPISRAAKAIPLGGQTSEANPPTASINNPSLAVRT